MHIIVCMCNNICLITYVLVVNSTLFTNDSACVCVCVGGDGGWINPAYQHMSTVDAAYNTM